MGELTGYDIARKLESYARTNGFSPPQAYYIVGYFNLRERNGKSVYSDEAHLWCEKCAILLLKRALRLMPKDKRDDYFICPTDAQDEDSFPHCMKCGETLDGSISHYCVEEELSHYASHPIALGDTINPRQAVKLAMVLYAAPDDPDVVTLGLAAIAAIDGATHE